MIRINFKSLRAERQLLNNSLVFIAIKTNDLKILKKTINRNELDRVLQELNISESELFKICSTNDITNKILSGRISKKSSRQGTMDELVQIGSCKEIGLQKGVDITILSKTAYRPTKKGTIVSNTELKQQKINLNECLKSFDAKISGSLTGWIFAKVIFGLGGHQDNAFEESDTLCNWVKTNKTNDLFVFLIDTDNDAKFDKLKEKYKTVDNILITNHYSFQEYLFNR